MIQQIIDIDKQMLLLINSWHSTWADSVMWAVSQTTTWLPLYLVMVAVLVYRFWNKPSKWTCVCVLVCFGLAVLMADQLSAHLIKPLVCRPRPTHDPEIGIFIHTVNGYVGGAYGFVSSHAANTMAVAMLFSVLIKKWYATMPLMIWVALVAYSRMYLGVHFPLDILGGWVIGALVALGIYAVLVALGERLGGHTAHR